MSKKLAPFGSPKPVLHVAPPPLDETAARAFVGGDESRESRLRRATPGERIGVYLPPELALALRHAALDQRRSVSDLLTEAAQHWLERSGAKGL